MTDKQIRRDVFHSISDLIAAIKQYLTTYDEGTKPFVWAAEVQAIIEKVRRARAALETTQ